MQRLIYRTQCREFEKAVNYFSHQKQSIAKLIAEERLLTISVFCWKNELFLYYECIEEKIEPETIFTLSGEYLNSWPGVYGNRYWVPMADIFHYNSPASLQHWKRNGSVQKRPARIARLKPEMISSYIFYHYQLQEEKPGIYDKYGIIGIHENLLFQYLEEPVAVEPALYKGMLDTQNTPRDWGDVMNPHFIKWVDAHEGQELWRDTTVILEI